MKSVVTNLILTVLIAIFSLPLLALYGLVFLGIGGGWANAGPNDCHFVIGPIGYLMLGPPMFAVGRVGWLVVQKIRPAY